jgi:hypothetical protein
MGTEDGAILGPVQNEMQYRKVRRLFEEVRQNGYVAKVGGEVTETKGFFLKPTIIDNPPPSSSLVTEEQFVRTPTHPGMRQCRAIMRPVTKADSVFPAVLGFR